MPASTPIMLVGNSVRYLAQSAHAAGLAAVGVDAFADDDMCAACRRHYVAGDLGPQALAGAVPDGGMDAGLPWTYTAGFEGAPHVLRTLLRRNRRLLGNDPSVLELLADRRRWFSLLSDLDVSVPAVRFTAPGNPSGWLFKPAGGAGGVGVRRAVSDEFPQASGFFQAFVKGPVRSLLFAADGHDIAVIGFNSVLARYPAAGDFRFAAVIGGLAMTGRQSAAMQLAAQRLTRALGLRGINGIDFVLDGGEPRLIDLNARPPASLELYERWLPGGGLACHLAACNGVLPKVVRATGSVGLRIVYTRRVLRLGEVSWPSGVRDRPPAGSRLAVHQPVCSVHVEGPDALTVEARLREAADAVHEQLHPFAEEAA